MMVTPVVDILRPVGASELISARAFEQAFIAGLASHVSIRTVPADEWLLPLFGAGDVPRPVAAARLQEATHASFLAPGHPALAFAPELTHLRNLSGARFRMLVIAHAPGVFLPEWALLEPLLRPGDRIVAPSRRAAEVIARLCPGLSAFVRVVPHPIPPLPARSAARATGVRRLVSLGRVTRSKLIHRQVEAMAILRQRGWDELRMDIAGPLNELGTRGLSAYVRSIQAKIARLRLDRHVRLVGIVEGLDAKAELLDGAALLLNLSVTAEESFGKAIVEANGRGIPCLVTDWGGLAETVGEGGVALAVERHPFGVDVSAERIADAIEALLRSSPDPERCRRQAAASAPERVAPRYRQLLDEALAEAASGIDGPDPPPDPPRSAPAAASGLLAVTAPLTALGWHEVMDMHQDEAMREPDLRGLEQPGLLSSGAQLRGLLCLGVMSEVQRAQAGLPPQDGLGPGSPVAALEGELLDRCSWAALHPGTRGSRVVCLSLLLRLGRHQDVRRGLEQLRKEGLDSPGLRYLEVELQRLHGDPSTALRMALDDDGDEMWGEHAAHRVIQLAQIQRQLGLVDDARSLLEHWTELYPDAPDAAGVWHQLVLCGLETEQRWALVQRAIQQTLALRGPWPELERLAAMLQSPDDADDR